MNPSLAGAGLPRLTVRAIGTVPATKIRSWYDVTTATPFTTAS
jgi:hypothetical protein